MNTIIVNISIHVYVYNESLQVKTNRQQAHIYAYFVKKKTELILITIIKLIAVRRQSVFSTYFLSESFPLNTII